MEKGITALKKIMEKTLLLYQLLPVDLQDLIKDAVRLEFESFKNRLAGSEPDVLMTRSETCEFLKINPTTLWNWTKSGRVIAYGIGNRVYYKKQEIIKKLVPLR